MDFMANAMGGAGGFGGALPGGFPGAASLGGLAPFMNPDGVATPFNGLFQTVFPSGGDEATGAAQTEETTVIIKKKEDKPLALALLVFPVIIAVVTVVVVAVTNTVVVVVTGFFPSLFPKKNEVVKRKPVYRKSYPKKPYPMERPVYDAKPAYEEPAYMDKSAYAPKSYETPSYKEEYPASSYRNRRSNPSAGAPLAHMPTIEQLGSVVRETLASEDCLKRAFCDSATITSSLPEIGSSLATVAAYLPESLKWMGDVLASAGSCSKYRCSRMD